MMLLDKFSFQIFRCKHDKNVIPEESRIIFGVVCEMCIILSYLLIQFSQTWAYCAKWNLKMGHLDSLVLKTEGLVTLKMTELTATVTSPSARMHTLWPHWTPSILHTHTDTNTHTNQNAAVHCEGVKKGSIWKENSEKLKQDQRKKIERVAKKDSEHLWPACEWSILGLMRQKGHKDVVNASSSIQNWK